MEGHSQVLTSSKRYPRLRVKLLARLMDLEIHSCPEALVLLGCRKSLGTQTICPHLHIHCYRGKKNPKTEDYHKLRQFPESLCSIKSTCGQQKLGPKTDCRINHSYGEKAICSSASHRASRIYSDRNKPGRPRPMQTELSFYQQ